MVFSYLVAAGKEMFLTHFPKVALSEFIFWLGYTYNKKPQMVDVGWAVNQWLVGVLVATRGFSDFSALSNTKTQIYLGALTLWALRLGGFLFYTRILHGSGSDPRYEELAKKFKNHKNLYYLLQFEQQGLLLMLTAFPLYFLFHQKSTSFAINNYIGLALSLTGIVCQGIADQQLYNFKKNAKEEDKKKIFRGGFWKKSRHPNLFFEVMIWSGFAISALDLTNLRGTGWALLGPLTLWGIMNFVTIPITERLMKENKPNFSRVVMETNKFIPI